MNAKELMAKIDIPSEFLERVIGYLDGIDISDFEDGIAMMLDTDRRNDGYKLVTEMLGEDGTGVKIFAIEITAAARAYEAYAALGIPDKIYFDTMRVFRRQLDESHTAEYGYIFDRGSWDVHQTSLTLFRIGELEYAFASKYGEDILAVHIPSDAVLTDENMDESFTKARKFFRKYFPEAGERRITCGTWLLSPRLREILPDSSKILKFQNRFHIERELGGESCLRWVFGIKRQAPDGLDLASLPERTSLQRTIKSKLLQGENIGQAYGIYKENDEAWKIELGKYRHYKGALYEVIALGRHSETLEDTVVYRALYGEGEIWVRPAYMWLQRVTTPGGQVRRFERVTD